jgi:UDP-glucose-4-epimerase GalE
MTHAILVTGGAGYVGSHTCLELAKEGYLPITIDNLSTGFAHNVKWGPLVEGDVHDNKLIVKIIKLYNIQAVIHFAGSAYVGESVKVPRKYYENNTVGTLSLLNSLIETGLTNIVFSSTCSVYGLADDCPITEETPLNPINPYGESKYFIEKILRSYQFAYGLNSISLRYFNAAGSDPDGNLGEEHNPETHLIPLALRACLEPERQLSIFGNNYTTPDGSAIRDYVHVKDLATAHIGAIKYITQKKGSHILNLGTGKGHSVLEIVKHAENITKRECHYVISDRRPGDPPELVANPQKAFEILKWKPNYSDIENIISTSWNWLTNKKKLS